MADKSDDIVQLESDNDCVPIVIQETPRDHVKIGQNLCGSGVHSTHENDGNVGESSDLIVMSTPLVTRATYNRKGNDSDEIVVLSESGGRSTRALSDSRQKSALSPTEVRKQSHAMRSSPHLPTSNMSTARSGRVNSLFVDSDASNPFLSSSPITRKRDTSQREELLMPSSPNFTSTFTFTGSANHLDDITNAVGGDQNAKSRPPVMRLEKTSTKTTRPKTKATSTSTSGMDRETAQKVKEANKVKKRSETCREITVELGTGIPDEIGKMVRELLRELQCSVSDWKSGIRCARFRRVVDVEYDAVTKQYVPTAPKERLEAYGIGYDHADDLVRMLSSDNLADRTNEIVSAFAPGSAIVYLIQGMATVVKRWQNEQNRQVRMRVLEHMQNSDTTSPRRLRRTQSANMDEVSPKKILRWLAQLEVEHDVKVVHTVSDEDTATWICNLAQDVSMAHWSDHKSHESGLLDVGRVPSGVDPRDATAKALTMIKYVTPQIGEGIAAAHGNLGRLMAQLKENGTGAFDGLYKPGVNQRRLVGSALASSIQSVFQCRDPSQLVE